MLSLLCVTQTSCANIYHSYSSDLIVLFESDQNKNDRTLNHLNRFRNYSLSDIDFSVKNNELVNCLNQVTQMKQIIETLCQKRIGLYKSRIEK